MATGLDEIGHGLLKTVLDDELPAEFHIESRELQPFLFVTGSRIVRLMKCSEGQERYGDSKRGQCRECAAEQCAPPSASLRMRGPTGGNERCHRSALPERYR